MIKNYLKIALNGFKYFYYSFSYHWLLHEIGNYYDDPITSNKIEKITLGYSGKCYIISFYDSDAKMFISKNDSCPNFDYYDIVIHIVEKGSNYSKSYVSDNPHLAKRAYNLIERKYYEPEKTNTGKESITENEFRKLI